MDFDLRSVIRAVSMFSNFLNGVMPATDKICS